MVLELNNFIGRKPELKALDDTYHNRDAFVLISGMRGSGKSHLVQHFLKDKEALIFSANEVSDKLNRQNFLDQISKYYDESTKSKLDLPEWESLFKAYASKPDNERKVLVLDNLELLIQNNPNFPKILAQSWEKYFKPNNILLIGILPNTPVLTELEDHKSPMMDKVNIRIKLQPVSFIEMLRDFPEHSFNELVTLYSITGGLPSYFQIFDQTHTIKEQLNVVRNIMLNPLSTYVNYPVSLLEKDVWEPVYYMTVLSYISQGINTVKELSKKTGYKQKDIVQYLENLEKLKLIRSECSIEQKKFKLRNARFYISNPALELWFKYVLPNKSKISIGESDIVVENIRGDFKKFIEEPYRSVCQEIFQAGIKQKSLDFDLTKIGRFWNKEMDIPLVAIDDNKNQIIFADIDFSTRPYTYDRFIEFVKSVEELKEFKRYKNYIKKYAVFSLVNPEKELIDMVLDNENAFIFSGTTLFKKQN